MFITVFGQKVVLQKHVADIAKLEPSQKRVVLVDADRNRSATAYGARGLLPCPVVPIEAAAKATRLAEIVITDGQASTNEEEMKNLVESADFILLPTTTQSRSIELTIEMAQTINKYKIPYALLSSAKKLQLKMPKNEGFDIKVLDAQIPLLSAFEQAETEGVTVDQAIDNSQSTSDDGLVCIQLGLQRDRRAIRRQNPIQSPIGWDFTPMEQRIAA